MATCKRKAKRAKRNERSPEAGATTTSARRKPAARAALCGCELATSARFAKWSGRRRGGNRGTTARGAQQTARWSRRPAEKFAERRKNADCRPCPDLITFSNLRAWMSAQTHSAKTDIYWHKIMSAVSDALKSLLSRIQPTGGEVQAAEKHFETIKTRLETVGSVLI